MGLVHNTRYVTYELLELSAIEDNHHTARISVSTKRFWRKPLVKIVDVFCRTKSIDGATRWYLQEDGTDFDACWAASDLAIRYLRLERLHKVD